MSEAASFTPTFRRTAPRRAAARPIGAALTDFAARLQALSADGSPDAAMRTAVLEAAREALAAEQTAVRERFFAHTLSGTEVVEANARVVDTLIATLYDFITAHVFPRANPTQGERMALVAQGGYGRGELAPRSDIDLLFLLPYKKTPHSEQVVEYILYLLWDLGFKVGQAIRSVEDCVRLAKEDTTIRTALLEARLIRGDMELFESLRRRFRAHVMEGTAAAYVDAKLAERDARHQRVGDSRYVLEPNVKEGKGGLRDLHTLFWIAKYTYGVDDVSRLVEVGVLSEREAVRFAKAQDFFWTVRCFLHYLTGREEDRLTFDMQERIAELMGYTDHAGTRGVERFMKHYFLWAKEVGDLTRIFCAALEDQSRRRPKLNFRFWGNGARTVDGFTVEKGRIRVASDTAFRDDPVALIRLFHVAHREDVDIHPATLKLITRSLKLIDDKLRRNKDANRLFLELLTARRNPEVVLRHMNEAGVFGRFVPDFGRVVGQMQHDMYHVYTVDEHTIFALGILHRIEEGGLKDVMPIASEVIHKIESRRALYVALLLHDIAKGRGGDHSVLGARIAERLGPRLGLTPEETESAAWLVRYHLIMSTTAFRRDIDDMQTLADFVALVQSPERLRLLLCLTVADIRAVGPTVWNGWKATLLRELYYAADAEMSGQNSGHARAERVNVARDALKARLTDWTGAETEEYVSRGYPPYWLSLDTDTHVRHAEIVRAAEKAGRPLTIDLRVDSFRAATEVTVYAVDDAGLFSRIAAGIALAGANIVDAKIFTMADGMALDSFWVQSVEGKPVTETAALRRLKDTLEKVISRSRRLGRKLHIKATLPARTRVFRDQPRVVVDNAASNTYTVVEVNGRDRPGFLYDVTHALTELNLQISSAKVSTYGTRAVDVFYVKDIFGLKITHDGRIAELRARLLEALVEPEEEKKAAAASPKPEAKPAAKARSEARAPSGADGKKTAKSKSRSRGKGKGPRAAGSRRKTGTERRPRGTVG
ncbi:MAG: [protein-PII] uridylyltransferase [Alphaproteobacteria bacterium]